ncbi:MAG: MarR family winged helix-turn-helix transcriptional regulator [Bryobacteraceae bacterium]|jgi:DNA-binding MarR family transcriptional regulator
MKSKGMTMSQYRALSEFRYQIRKFLHFSENAARTAGLEPQQHQLLLAVKGYAGDGDGPTIGYLAERLKLRHHTTVELVDRMEERLMVYRRIGEEDRRRVIVGLTKNGEGLLDKLSNEHITELQQMGPGLIQALQQVIAGARSGVPQIESK